MMHKFINNTVEVFKDLLRVPEPINSNKVHIDSAIKWLKKAQDVTNDGGVSAYYSLITGWAPSFVETTGYIIDTFLDYSNFFRDSDAKKRAVKMGRFIMSMQLKNGGFRTYSGQGDGVTEPTIFNSGQDLLGLVRLYQDLRDSKYYVSAVKAGEFLCANQEKEGYWISYSYESRMHSYDSRVALSLVKLFTICKKKKFIESALRNLNWVVSVQHRNGWIPYTELPNGFRLRSAFTHTISYAVEGLLDSGILLKNIRFIKSAKRSADALLNYYMSQDFLPATFNNNWESIDSYSCLTGNAQLSVVWGKLYRVFKEKKYLVAMMRMNNFLKSTHKTTGLVDLQGVKGSYPIYGDIWRNRGYSRMAYLNWATKFYLDALFMEMMLREQTR